MIYESVRTGRDIPLPPLHVQYKDFAARQRKRLAAPLVKAQALDYWSRLMAARLPQPALPYDYPQALDAAGAHASIGGIYRYVVDGWLKDRLKQVAIEKKTGLFTVLFSLFNLIISHLCRQDVVVCRVARAQRDHEALHPMVGYFINPVVSRIEAQQRQEGKEADRREFTTFLRQVHEVILESFREQEYPMELALQELQLPVPSLHINFNMLNMFDRQADMELRNTDPRHKDSNIDEKFTFALIVIEYKNGIELFWRYKKALFKPQSIEHICNLFMDILKEITMGKGYESVR